MSVHTAVALVVGILATIPPGSAGEVLGDTPNIHDGANRQLTNAIPPYKQVDEKISEAFQDDIQPALGRWCETPVGRYRGPFNPVGSVCLANTPDGQFLGTVRR